MSDILDKPERSAFIFALVPVEYFASQRTEVLRDTDLIEGVVQLGILAL